MVNAVVTTVRDCSVQENTLACFFASKLDIPFVKRKNYSIENIKADCNTESVLVITKTGPVIYTSTGEYYFHLSMAELRIKNLNNGKHDHMVAAMDLSAGSSILDCTLGLGTDAIVASYYIGTTGKITGIEASPFIAAITEYGLQNYQADSDCVTNSLRRIKVENDDYNFRLSQYNSNSFDVVYFDPMFRTPVKESSSMKPLRGLADNRPVTIKAVNEAIRIAKKRVVIKETRGSSEFARLGVDTIVGGKYSSVSYGIIRTGG